MKKVFLLLIGFTLLTSFKASFHDFYLSVTEIEYKSEKNDVQVITRVFINDFEDVINKRYGKDISLSYKEDLSTHKDLIKKYLFEKLKISADGKELKMDYVGAKFDADQIIIFTEVPEVTSFQKVKVKDAILTDLFDDQKNIVHVKKKKEIKSLLLGKGNDTETVIFP